MVTFESFDQTVLAPVNYNATGSEGAALGPPARRGKFA